MPVKYVGRQSAYKGKFLFEILGQLKNFGSGRIVVRNSLNSRYAEPSYYRITKAFPKLDDPEHKRGHVHAIRVFRGRQLAGEQVITTGYTPDWRLVSREDEAELIRRAAEAAVATSAERPKPPAEVEMPPLFESLYISRLQRSGTALQGKPMLKLQFRARPPTEPLQTANHERSSTAV